MGPIQLPSIFFITFLLLIGLFFFIRASVKARTESIELQFNQSSPQITEQLQTHFNQRAYHLVNHDPNENQFILEGMVAPSFFLAIFLSLLAAIGLLCLGLILSISLPQHPLFSWALPILSPLAGLFYWRRAKRIEQVSFVIRETEQRNSVIVTAHRDELIALRQTFKGLLPINLA